MKHLIFLLLICLSSVACKRSMTPAKDTPQSLEQKKEEEVFKVVQEEEAPMAEQDLEVNWLTFEEAVVLNRSNPKKLLVDLYTDWCGWCKVMDRNTYSKAEIASYINEHFYPVKFNAEQKEEVIFDGNTFAFVPTGRRGYHQLAAALTSNKLSYPTTVFMDEELRIIQPIAGYLKAEQMEPILLYIGGDHFKTTKWVDFTQSNKSSL